MEERVNLNDVNKHFFINQLANKKSIKMIFGPCWFCQFDPYFPKVVKSPKNLCKSNNGF